MNKRSTKWYRKNEAEVMHRLGFNPTRNSGATWIEKGDGQSDHCLCELKSTDKESYSLKQTTLHVLEAQALESHKLPVFALQFLNVDEVWLMVKETDIEAFKQLIVAKELEEKGIHGEVEKRTETIFDFDIDAMEEQDYNREVARETDLKKQIAAREKYYKQREKEREQTIKENRQKQTDRNKRREKKHGRKEIQTKRSSNL